MQLLLVGLGGFGGAVLRWLVDGWVSERNPTAFPLGRSSSTSPGWRLIEEGAYGLAMANLVGSVVLGLVAVVAGLAVGRLVP